MNSTEIRSICLKYRDSGYFVAPTIPEKKLNNAKAHYDIPFGEEVIALVDCSILGHAKVGLAICSGGLYWNNDWMTSTSIKHLNWSEFAEVEPSLLKYDIQFRDGAVLSVASSGLKKGDLIQILKEIRFELLNGKGVDRQNMQASSQPKTAITQASSPRAQWENTTALAAAMALATFADGDIEDAEVELAMEIINGIDSIREADLTHDVMNQFAGFLQALVSETEGKPKALRLIPINNMLNKLKPVTDAMWQELIVEAAQGILATKEGQGPSQEEEAILQKIACAFQEA
ncbi:hypothetical protein D3C72_837950 [compost metagenome]